MDRSSFNTLLIKYTLLLTLPLCITYLYTFTHFNLIEDNQSYGRLEFHFRENLAQYINFLLNLVLAIVVFSDMQKQKSINWLIVIITVLSGILGVVLFFIRSFFQAAQKDKIASH